MRPNSREESKTEGARMPRSLLTRWPLAVWGAGALLLLTARSRAAAGRMCGQPSKCSLSCCMGCAAGLYTSKCRPFSGCVRRLCRVPDMSAWVFHAPRPARLEARLLCTLTYLSSVCVPVWVHRAPRTRGYNFSFSHHIRLKKVMRKQIRGL